MSKKVILVVRDGWGHREEKSKGHFLPIFKNIFKKEIGQNFNAIKLARTERTDYLEKTYPTFYINASGH
jgi:bisphosphoglycerate-independent phosphoglycerate mutase (AlkP superfamily)